MLTSLSETEMLREIEAALPLVFPVATEWGLVQDRVMETSVKMGDIEALIKMSGKLDMDNDLDSVNSLELTHTVPSQEVTEYMAATSTHSEFGRPCVLTPRQTSTHCTYLSRLKASKGFNFNGSSSHKAVQLAPALCAALHNFVNHVGLAQ